MYLFYCVFLNGGFLGWKDIIGFTSMYCLYGVGKC